MTFPLSQKSLPFEGICYFVVFKKLCDMFYGCICTLERGLRLTGLVPRKSRASIFFAVDKIPDLLIMSDDLKLRIENLGKQSCVFINFSDVQEN